MFKSESGSNVAMKSFLPGAIVTAILVVVEVIFGFILVRSRLAPFKYVLAAIVALLLLTLIIGFLTHRIEKKGRFITGVISSILVIAVLIYGVIGLNRVTNMLNTITTTKTEVTNVGVYVLKEDSAQNLDDLSGESFGILRDLQRGTTDKAIEQINDKGVVINTAEYDGLTSLVDALYNQESRAIILNSAYIDVIQEIVGYEDIEDRIREIAVFGVEDEVRETPTESAVSDSVFTMYISGIDSRNGLTAKSRSDVNILATVNTDTNQVLLVTTPRDYFVELPISNGAKDKLTHAGIYGVDVSMGTLAMLYDLENIDYYFRVSFGGVVDIVDAIGGVSVYSDYEFSSGGNSFVEGYNNVNGKQALSFVRERYSFNSGDRQRGKNQTALIKAIIDKVVSPDILVNYASILKAMEGNFETSMSYDEIASLASDQLATGGSWDVISYSVDGFGSTEVPYSMSQPAYVMIPDEPTVMKAQELMQAMQNGEKITQP